MENRKCTGDCGIRGAAVLDRLTFLIFWITQSRMAWFGLACLIVLGSGSPVSPAAGVGPGVRHHGLPLACFCSLTPPSASGVVGSSHSVTYTYTCNDGEKVFGIAVTLNITSGPNAGYSANGVTDGGGHVSFSYASNGQPGMDALTATGVNAAPCSATMTWTLPDGDGDGVPDASDNCPTKPNPGQQDSDGDGRGDVCDNCPGTPNPDQADSNGNGIGDACEPRSVVDNGPPDYNLTIDPVVKPPCGCNSDGSRTSFTGSTCTNCQITGSYPGIRQDTGPGTVYLHNGEFVHHAVDLEIPGRGFNWRFVRSYRSGMSFNGPMGHGWEFNYNRRIYVPLGGPVLRMDGFARADAYIPKGNGVFTSPKGVYAQLRRNTDGSMLEREPNGTRIRYSQPDVHGIAVMTELTDRMGNTMRFSYNGQNQLVRVLDTMGRPIDYRYDPDGRLIEVSDFAGRSLLFEYDVNGDLVAARSPVVTGTPTRNDFSQGKTTRYRYSSGFSEETLNHNLTEITAPNEVASGGPARTRVEYETNPVSPNRDRVQRQTLGGTNAPAVFSNGRIQFRSDLKVPAGGTISYQYAFLANVPANDFNSAVSQTTAVDRNGNRTEYQFNQLGNITRIREFTNRDIRAGDPDFYETRYEYNLDGQMTRMIYPEGNSVEYVYDDQNPIRYQQGNLLAEIKRPDAKRGGDQAFLKTTYSYEPIFNLRRSVTDPRGNDPSFVPPNGGANSPGRYITQSIFDYQEGSNFAALGQELGISANEVRTLLEQANIAMGLGDLNGDGRTDQIAGNMVKDVFPTVNLLPDSNMARIEGGTRQPIEELFVHNAAGQRVRHVDQEGNVDLYEYYPENDPDGDGRDLTPGAGTGPFGYLKAFIQDAQSNPIRDSKTDPKPAQIERQFFYDRVGHLIKEVNGRGVATQYLINQLGQIVQIIRAADVSEALKNPKEPNFGGCSDPDLVECKAGIVPFKYVINRFYDYNDNLVRIEFENRDSNNSQLAGPFIEYTIAYDILDLKIEATSEVSESPRQVVTTRYRYDRNQNQVLEISPIAGAGTQPANVVAKVLDERDLESTITRGGLTQQFRALAANADIPERNQITNSPDISTTSRAYDLNRNLMRLTDAVDNNADGQPESTTFLHDGFDRTVSSVDAAGNQWLVSLDPAGNATRTSRFGPVGGPTPTSDQAATFTQPLTLQNIRQPLLNQAESKFDEQNRVFESDIRLFDYRQQGVNYARVPQLADGPLGGVNDGMVVTRYEYDRKDRQRFSIQDDFSITETRYDGTDRKIEQIDPEGNRLVYSYDDQDNLVKVVQHETTGRDRGSKIEDGESLDLTEIFTTINVFDSLDRLIRTTDNLGQTHRNRYDSRDNLIESTDAQSSQTPAQLISDPLGLFPAPSISQPPASTINRPGNRISYLYDGINRRIAEARDLRVNGQGDQPLETANAANPDGRVTLQTTWDANSRITMRMDDKGNTTRYQYDNLNRIVQEVFADGTMNAHTYDADGHRIQTVDENRSVIHRQFDGIGRPAGLTITRGSGVVGTTQQSFEFDGLSRLMRAVDNNEPGDSTDDAVVTLAYDSLNRRLEEVQNGQAVGSHWAGDNERLGLVYPNNRELGFTLDRLHRIRQITDQASRITNLIAEYTYIGPARVLERTYGNGSRLTYLNNERTQDVGYDGNKRVVTLRHLRADNSPIAGFSYDYDRQNNKLSAAALDQPNVSERYSYDSLYRLVQSTASTGSSDSFQLDGAGNWMRRNQAANQVNAVNEYEQFASVAQPHDANGNLTDDGRNRYEYDALNRLRRVTRRSDNAVVAIYRYDALNRRVERVVTNSGALNERVQYLYDGWREIEERRGSAAQQYVYGMWIDEPLTLDKDDNNDGVVDQTFFYHQDGKTNVVALTDATGGLVQTITYDAYGRPNFGQNALATFYLFAGRRYDPETGLYYFRARFYDPVRGRFLQRDPIGMWTDKANLGNGYTYVGNNPMTWTDPLGLLRKIRNVKGGCSAFCDGDSIACCGATLSDGSHVNGCSCMPFSIYVEFVEAGASCDDAGQIGGPGAVNSCIGVDQAASRQPTCSYSPVAAAFCSAGGVLGRAPDGQVSPLNPIHLPIRELPTLISTRPPAPPSGAGSSRCGGRGGIAPRLGIWFPPIMKDCGKCGDRVCGVNWKDGRPGECDPRECNDICKGSARDGLLLPKSYIP